MKDHSVFNRIAQEPVVPSQSLREILWRPDDQVQWKWRRDGTIDFHRLIELVLRGHDHEQIDITFGVRSADSVRSEQNNPLGCKMLDEPINVAADRRPRHAA